MKAGNISQTVWKRSIQKQLNTKKEEILFAPSMEEPCTGICTGDGFVSVSADYQTVGKSVKTGVYAAAGALNELKIRGAEVLGVTLRITTSLHTSEARLKSMISNVCELCKQADTVLAGVKCEVNPAVSQTIVCAQAHGRISDKQHWIAAADAAPGQDIVQIGFIGLEGSLRILEEREEELKKRFVPSFIRQIKGLERYLYAGDMISPVKDFEISAVSQIGSGGIIAALWNLASASGVGLNVELSKMSIRQETVEICECYNLNPYQMTSAGSFLVVTPRGDELVKALKGAGARATRLGITTDTNDRVITSGEEKRYLDIPAPDELMRWWQEELS